MARRARGAAPRPVRQGDFPPTGWVASACPLGTPARGACGRGGCGAARARARGVARRARGRPHRGRHRRLHPGPPGAARRDRQAYAGPGARDRAARAGSVPVPALRQARLRLLAADAGGTARRRGLPRQGAGPRAHPRGAGDPADPGPSRALRERSYSGRRRRSRTVGQGSSARPRTVFRSSVRSPATTTSGSPVATRVTATCSVSLAASSSPKRFSDDRHPGSNCSNPHGC